MSMEADQIASALVIPYWGEMNGKMLIAARNLLGWSQAELATRAKISRATLVSLETGSGDPRRSSLDRVVATLSDAGVEFTEMPGKMSVAVNIKRPE